MILSTERTAEFFQGFRADLCSTDEKAILIFVSTEDCDSLCAGKILAALLQSDGIPYCLVPVSNQEQVKKEFECHAGDSEDLRTAFLVGLGANVNSQEIGLPRKQNVRIVILDSHRPVHHSLNNPEDANTIIMVDPQDETAQPENIPYADDDEVSTSGSDGENDENRPSPGLRKRRKVERAARNAEKLKHLFKGTYYGSPAAYVVWQMGLNLSRDTPNHLWLCILSVTEQYLQQHMTTERYGKFYLEFETKLRSSGVLDVEEQHVLEEEGTTVNKPLTGRIKPADDFKFPLLRNWTVWDSIVCSPYVAARLRTFHQRGKDHVQLLLVRMGLPLKDCQNSYRGMAPEQQQRFVGKLAEEGGKFKLGDSVFQSFLWQEGYDRVGLSASDVVYALSALMENSEDRLGAEWKWDGFWKAWEGLTPNKKGYDLLKEGLELAKQLMTAIVGDGGSGILRKKHCDLGVVLWNFSDMDFTDKVFVNKPLAVVRLGRFLQDYWFHVKGKRCDMILIGPQDAEGNCLMVSMTAEKANSKKGNRFGTAFAITSEAMNCNMQYQGFDNTVVKVAAKIASAFAQSVIAHYLEPTFMAATQGAS